MSAILLLIIAPHIAIGIAWASWELLLQPQDSVSEAEGAHIDPFIEAVHRL